MSKNIIKCECCGCHYIESEETDNLCAKCNEYIHKQRQELQELKEWNIKVETEHEEMIQEYDKRIVKLEELQKRFEQLQHQLKEQPKQIVEKIKEKAIESYYTHYEDAQHNEFDYLTPYTLDYILDEILKEYQGDVE